MNTDLNFAGHGDTYAQDMAACSRVNDVLQRHYPDHPWMIGCDHFAGVVDIRLMYASGTIPTGYGFRLKLSTVLGPDGDHKIKMAGGETLERWGLQRQHATDQSALRAAEHGLDISDLIRRR